MARRWPVLHLANEKSVPFDVAPTRAWWESLLYRPLLHPSPFTEQAPSSSPRKSFAVLPSPALRQRGPFYSILRDTFSISAILLILSEVNLLRKLMKLGPLIRVFGLFVNLIYRDIYEMGLKL